MTYLIESNITGLLNTVFHAAVYRGERKSGDSEIATLLDAEVGTKVEASILTICVIGYKSLLPIGLNVLDNCEVLVSRCLTVVRCSTTVSRLWPASPKRAGWPVGYRTFRIIKGSIIVVDTTTALLVDLVRCSAWTEKAWIKRRSQLVIRLKAIENAMGFSLLLFFQPPLLTSDLRLSNLGLSNWSRGN